MMVKKALMSRRYTTCPTQCAWVSPHALRGLAEGAVVRYAWTIDVRLSYTNRLIWA